MSGTSFNTDRTPTCDEVVSALLSGHPLGQPVSTHLLLKDFYATAPASLETDDTVLESIVRIATGRTMAVVFDHREVSERLVLTRRPSAVI